LTTLLVFFTDGIDVNLILRFSLLFLLLISSGMTSGSEVAFFALSPATLKSATNHHNRKNRLMAKLRSNPQRLLATILILNNLINISIVMLFASMNHALFSSIPYQWLTLVVEVGFVAAFILIFGDIIPKVYANRNAESFALLMTLPLFVIDRYLLFFFAVPLSKFTFFFQNKLQKQKSEFSVDQLSKALELTDDSATSVEEQKLLEGIVNFGTFDVKQVMRPRIDVFALNQNESFDEVLEKVVEKGYSRIPVYAEHIDTITGILYVKDLLPHIQKIKFNWVSLLRDPYFVPENKKLDDLLNEFQSKRIHLAIVVDEYGGTSGVVSLEDVIEEIVGEISDEFDEDDLMFSKIDDHTFVMEGKTYLKDFYRIMSMKDPKPFEDKKGESETIAGFVLEHLGYFPKTKTSFSFHGYLFVVEATDRKRIKQIKVTKHSK
jgi:putative hemolysin